MSAFDARYGAGSTPVNNPGRAPGAVIYADDATTPTIRVLASNESGSGEIWVERVRDGMRLARFVANGLTGSNLRAVQDAAVTALNQCVTDGSNV